MISKILALSNRLARPNMIRRGDHGPFFLRLAEKVKFVDSIV